MSDAALQDIHRLQRSDVDAANRQLLRFIRDRLKLPFVVQSVELRPGAVSLNSISGVLHTSAGRKFFKTHVEPASVVGEFYNVTLLADAGYHVLAPVFASTAYGRQFLVYEWFEAPTLFEALRAIETGADSGTRDLLAAVQASDDLLVELYTNSLRMIDAETHAKQPVHQLFLHRLAGARYRDFYSGAFFLPRHRIAFADLAGRKWIINGVAYRDTLETSVAKAIAALRFSGARQIAAVAGHGDAHAGNLFYFGPKQSLAWFDPAFAGTHSPLLDIIKPLIHDSLLKWLYFPDEVAAETAINYRLPDGAITVEHDYSPSSLRTALFDSRLTRIVAPMLRRLKASDSLPGNWLAIMQAAAMCCPLLTMNLADRNRFSPEVALLGLATAVELGGCADDPVHLTPFERRLQEVALQ